MFKSWNLIIYITNNSQFLWSFFFFFPLWRGKGWKWTLLYLKIVLKRSDILCENIYFTLLYRSILSVCGGTGTLQIKTGPNSLLFSIFMYALVWLSSHSVSRGLPGWQADLYPAVLYPKFHSGVWSPRLQDCGTVWLHWPRTLNQEPYAGSPSMLKGLGQRFIRPFGSLGLCRAQGSPPSRRKPSRRALAGLMKRVPCTTELNACDSGGHSHHSALSCGVVAVDAGGPEVPHVSGPRGEGTGPCPDGGPPSPVPGTRGSPRC